VSSETNGFEIAIVGMSGRFPGSKNVKEFWENLCAGKELITHFNKEELLESGIPKEFIDDPTYVRSRGIIEDADEFDAKLFGFYPKEVEMLDPQQRLFLECTWEAMEDAGYTPDNYEGLAGVFGGIGMNTYVLQFLNSNKDLTTSAEGYQLSIGNDKDFLTTRVSYKLNLKGPSLDVQTACSTSSVATHLACMNLLNFQCDLAIAGGTTISTPIKSGYHYQEGMILSPDGHCRPFDEKAGGTVAGSGVGIVVLKRLEDAISDKDNIYAVIKGSAYNNDGSMKVGYTAPGVMGQTEVISSAYAMADVPMETIGYIEAHGTGTTLGDPIEVEALTDAFRQETDNTKYCAIGSVKSNVGHLDTAAGVTGLIKAALSVYHGVIPPSINYTSPNPKINFDESPFYVNTELNEWKSNGNPRRAGVSSFGIGGTNVHIVLEQPPKTDEVEKSIDWHLLPFSAKTSKSLIDGQNKFKEYIETNDEGSIRDIAYTLQTGRKHFEKRHFTVANNKKNLLKSFADPLKINNANILIENPSVVFMFSGQGSQYVNMCKELYEADSIFEKYADECFDILHNDLYTNLKNVIFPENDNNNEASEKLKQTEYTQPALFVIEYSLAMTLIDLGIYPQKMVGHSIGEFVAACIAGVMDLETALTLVVKRGQLMQSLDKGLMLSIVLPEKELLELIPSELDLAVINAPNLCVVSGQEDRIIEFSKSLKEKEIVNTILHTSHAFHSRMMDPILTDFKSLVESFNLSTPSIPYFSNVTGELITDENATDPNYYVNHLRYTVRFSENISNILEDKKAILLEVGPGSTLVSLAKYSPKGKGRTIINSVKHPKQEINDKEMFLTAIGNLWLSGLEIDWNKFYDDKPSRVHLPTYAFDKKRYWLKTKSNVARGFESKSNDNLYHYTSWKRKRIKSSDQIDKGSRNTILTFEDDNVSITKLLSENELVEKIITVIPGKKFNVLSPNKIEMNPSSRNEYIQLFEELIKSNTIPNKIIHNWSSLNNNGSNENFDSIQSLGYFSLVNLANAIFEKDITHKIQVDVITSGIFDVIGTEELNPNKSTILGACKVIHQEFENLKVRTIDIESSNDPVSDDFTHLLSEEVFNIEMETAIALRGNHRWVQTFEPLEIDNSNSKSLIAEKGVYIITGGLGRIGLTLAEFLSAKYKAKIYLLDQIELPPKAKWYELINQDKEKNFVIDKVTKLKKLDDIGVNINVRKVDTSNFAELKNIFDGIMHDDKNINGVFHAAGSLGEDMAKLVYQVSEKSFSEQIKTKIKSTENLSLILEDKKVDFVLLQSSLSAILGGLGFASYAAANCYLDAFVQSKVRNGNKTKWITVNWDAWSFDKTSIGEEVKAITPKVGIKSFEKILTQKAPQQVIVATGNLDDRINQWIIDKGESENESIEDENIELHERPNINSEYVEPKTDLEKQILPEWIKLLGIEKIGINDNFFDLGGDSLIGTQLVSRMRKIFSVDIPIQAIFENATIKGIAELIQKEKNNGSSDDNEKLSNVLDLLDNISDEEAAKLLNDKNK